MGVRAWAFMRAASRRMKSQRDKTARERIRDFISCTKFSIIISSVFDAKDVRRSSAKSGEKIYYADNIVHYLNYFSITF